VDNQQVNMMTITRKPGTFMGWNGNLNLFQPVETAEPILNLQGQKQPDREKVTKV
jgi:hypothetical protein